jgi:hypothetical protein
MTGTLNSDVKQRVYFLDCDRGQAPEAMEQNMLVSFYTASASPLATMERNM